MSIDGPYPKFTLNTSNIMWSIEVFLNSLSYQERQSFLKYVEWSSGLIQSILLHNTYSFSDTLEIQNMSSEELQKIRDYFKSRMETTIQL